MCLVFIAPAAHAADYVEREVYINALCRGLNYHYKSLGLAASSQLGSDTKVSDKCGNLQVRVKVTYNGSPGITGWGLWHSTSESNYRRPALAYAGTGESLIGSQHRTCSTCTPSLLT